MSLPTKDILDSPVTCLGLEDVIKQIFIWSSRKESRVVCVADAHMLIESYSYGEFNAILRRADMVTPDGMPLVWMLKLLGIRRQTRVAGMDILLGLARTAPLHKTSLFFLGSEETVLQRIRKRLSTEFPDLQIAGMSPLPFRPLTQKEDESLIEQINNSGAGIVLVALGCPKQEVWMDQHRDQIQSVMVGVGGAFPVYAGILRRAPTWLRAISLEWAYRLVQEPRRLWGRYRQVIPMFLYLACKQLVASTLLTKGNQGSLVALDSIEKNLRV